jgi:hypothetical protein
LLKYAKFEKVTDVFLNREEWKREENKRGRNQNRNKENDK